MVNMNDHLKNLTRVSLSGKYMVGLVKNVEYRAISAEATTAHGLSPILCILDEIGQIVGSTSPFIDAITTSQGAYDNPLLIAISTSAPSDTDLLSLWVDDAKRSADPHIICHEYRADDGCDLLDETQWLKANPALGEFRNKRDLEEQLKEAARLPHQEAAARNLLLNQRVSLVKLWLSPTVWRENGSAPDLKEFRRKHAHVSMGLDLSEKSDLTAAVISVLGKDGNIHSIPFCFIPAIGVEDKERRDKQPYFLHIKNRHLFPVGGTAMSYEEIASFLKDQLDELKIEISSVQFDRWKIENFKIACRAVGFLQESVWQPVGQGYKDFSPRVDKVEEMLLSRKVKHGLHPLLTSAAAHAIVVPSPAGDKKLDKSKTTQRIDPLIAMIMSVYGAIEGNEGSGDMAWLVA
jgi:phage terminase large subunit-like protein